MQVFTHDRDGSDGLRHPSAQAVAPAPDFLTQEEDDELRRLSYLAKVGVLSPHKTERMLELRLRDRRKEVREPREFSSGR